MQFKFISLNLWYGGKLFDNIVSFLRREQPDILALQEVYNGTDNSLSRNYRSVQELKELLQLLNDDFAPAFCDHRPEGFAVNMGNAVLTRFSILGSDVVFYDAPYDENYVEANRHSDYSQTPRNLQHVQLDIAGKVLNVFNTQGIWGFDGDDNERRTLMSDTIIEKIKGKDNVILAGDFNTKEKTSAMQNVGGKLHNVFGNELATSFNMRRKPANSGFEAAVVDMVFTSSKIKVIEHRVPDADVSDHVPFVCVCEL